MSEFAYPLAWPATWPRTNADKRAADKFHAQLPVATEELLHELRLLKAKKVSVTSNLEIGSYGSVIRSQPRPEDPGVAVYFTYKDRPLCIPCDSWIEVRGNMRAIGLAIGAIRGLERWGAGGMVNAAFSGFAALPPHASPESCWSILELDPKASREHVEAAYRRLSKHFHPDVGGSDAAFRRLQDAYQEALRDY